MNLAHIHLLLNHTPTIGFGIAVGLYLAALLQKNDSLKRTGLVLLFLTAVLAIPTYASGNFAELEICPDGMCASDVSVALIRAHEDLALLAFVFMEITGFVAWLAIWQLRLKPRLPGWNSTAVLLLALVTFGLMGLAANRGGQIRHAEMYAAEEGSSAVAAEEDPSAVAAEEDPSVVAAEEGPSAVADDNTGVARWIGEVVSGATGNGWLWPAAETIHFIGLCLLFAVVLLVNLRILGMAKPVSFVALYRLLPLGMVGFGLNLMTGMLFFIGKPSMYMSPVFYWKVALIVLGGVNVLYFTSVNEPWAVGPGNDAPPRAKMVAASAIVVWLGVLYCGHMLPFLGLSF
jgi:uncharacterized membrane protein